MDFHVDLGEAIWSRHRVALDHRPDKGDQSKVLLIARWMGGDLTWVPPPGHHGSGRRFKGSLTQKRRGIMAH